jgi:hypothetical protein
MSEVVGNASPIWRDGDYVVCNIAAWSNFDKLGDEYVTVELPPNKLRLPPIV